MKVLKDIASYLTFPLGGKKMLSRTEIADTIDAFVGGTGDNWDWDDFVSVPLNDPELDEVRKEAASIPDRFPSDRSNMYCSSEGLQELLRISKRLRATIDQATERD